MLHADLARAFLATAANDAVSNPVRLSLVPSRRQLLAGLVALRGGQAIRWSPDDLYT